MTGVFFFFVGTLALAGIFAVYALTLNMEAGWAGMWNLGVAGFLAIGSYTFVLTTQTQFDDVEYSLGWPMWAGIIAASLVTGAVALLVGLPTLRVRGEYFLIATLAFAEVVRQLAINLNSYTRGTVGFSRLDRPFESLATGRAYRLVLLGIVAAVVLLVYLLSRRVGWSPFGRLLRAFRDNDPVALSLGKHTNRYRIQTFVLTGMLYGATAPLYIWFIRGLTPSLFAADLTFVVWTALVIGGIGSMAGPIIGAVVLLLLTESVALLQGSPRFAELLASSRFLILGLALILVMRIRPQGLLTERGAFEGASERVPGGLQPEPKTETSLEGAE